MAKEKWGGSQWLSGESQYPERSILIGFYRRRHIHYSSLSWATAFQLGRLQRLQNRAARLITGVGIRDHITPVLEELHWLPIEFCIHFKVLLYIFKALRGQAPQYLGQLCCYKQRPSHLRQPKDFSLQVPLTQRSATEAAFNVQGPVLWNKFPHDIKTALNSVNIFKKKLKTHFFRLYFP